MRTRAVGVGLAVVAVGALVVAALGVMGGSVEPAEEPRAEPSETGSGPVVGVSWASGMLEGSVEQFGSVTLEAEVTLDQRLADAVLLIDGGVVDLVGAEKMPLGALEAGAQTVALVVGAARDVEPGRFEGELRLADGDTPVEAPLEVSVSVTELDVARAGSELLEPAGARISRSSQGVVFVHDELTIVFEDEPAGVDEIAEGIGARLVGSSPRTGTVQLLLDAPASLDELLDVAEQVTEDPRVAVALPSMSSGVDEVRYPTNDPVWPEPIWGATRPGFTWHMEQVRAPQAWASWTGIEDDAVAPAVAIIDLDFDPAHEDLSFVDVSRPGRVWAADGHGNHVAGIACANGNNGVGVSGVAWRCELHGFNVGFNYYVYEPDEDNNDGVRGELTYRIWSAWTFEAMVDAAQAGVRVANLSIGFPGGPPEEADQRCAELGVEGSDFQRAARLRHLQYAAATDRANQVSDELGNEPVLWVTSAGNDACASALYQPGGMTEPQVPALPSDTWVTVAATDRTGGLSDFSNYPQSGTIAAPGGSLGAHNIQLDPGQRGGQHIISTWACPMGQDTDCAYTEKSGTSMAAPMVTGTAALMLIANPDLTASQLKECLIASTENRGIPHPYEDELLPFGLLDTHAAMGCAISPATDLVPSDLLAAPVPSLCEHPAGVLEDGWLPGISEGDGFVALGVSAEDLRNDDVSSSQIAKGDLSGDGRSEIAVVVECNRGGVRWPDSVLVYGSGPELLGVFEPGEHVEDFVNRAWVGSVDFLEPERAVRIDWLTGRAGDFASGMSLPASALLRVEAGSLSVDSIETFDELPLVYRVLEAAGAGDRETLAGLLPESFHVDWFLMSEEIGWDGEPDCYGMTEWPPPSEARRICSLSYNDGRSAIFLGLDMVGGEWRVVEVSAAG